MRGRITFLTITVISASGCSDALIYGERTSFHAASIHLNDDPSQPVKINFGLNREAVAVAPSIGEPTGFNKGDTKSDGEAVSMISSFAISDERPLLFISGDDDASSDSGDEIFIQSQFATGAAALAVAEQPAIAAQIMGVGIRPIGIETSDESRIRDYLSRCAQKPEGLSQLGSLMHLDASSSTQEDIRAAIAQITADQFHPIQTELAKICGQYRGP